MLNLYRTQVRILWNWRGGWWALTKRIIITLLVATVAFMATAYILPGIAVVRVVCPSSRRARWCSPGSW